MLVQASQSDYTAIINLLREERFPNLPTDGTAETLLDTAKNFLLVRHGETIGWVCLHGLNDGVCSLDIAIKSKWHGKWLTKGLIKALGKCIFTDMKVKALYVECFVDAGTRLALKLGFKNTVNDPQGGVGMVLTREDYESKFNG